jgi:hemoglobin-like flavoprotein
MRLAYVIGNDSTSIKGWVALDSIGGDIVEQFHESLERCGDSALFLGRFYEIFTASSPEIAEKFTHTDLKTQTRVLKTSFYMAMLAADREHSAEVYLHGIAERHNHQGLDIKPEYYTLWLESLIVAVSEFDPHFNEDVEMVWRRFMQPAIDLMIARY